MSTLQKLIYWGRDRRNTTIVWIVGIGLVVGGFALRNRHHCPHVAYSISALGLVVFGFGLYLAFGTTGRTLEP